MMSTTTTTKADPIQRMAALLRLRQFPKSVTELQTSSSSSSSSLLSSIEIPMTNNVVENNHNKITGESESTPSVVLNHFDEIEGSRKFNTITTKTAETFVDVTTKNTGRGSTAGWTTCPLCSIATATTKHHRKRRQQQIRRYALGRGIASHLHAIHTPWFKSNKKSSLNSSSLKPPPPPPPSNRKKRQQQQERQPRLSNEISQDHEHSNNSKRQKHEALGCNKNNNYNINNNSKTSPTISTPTQTVATDDDTTNHRPPPPPHQQQSTNMDRNNDTATSNFAWIPTVNEIEAWNTQVLQIVTQLEQIVVEQVVDTESSTTSSSSSNDNRLSRANSNTASSLPVDILPPGFDRNGNSLSQISADTTVGSSSFVSTTSHHYSTNLPTFLQAAADGNLQQLQFLIQQQVEAHHHRSKIPTTHDRNNRNMDTDESTTSLSSMKAIDARIIRQLINTRDKHGSIAEHWAAGGGHVPSLQYLIQLRKQYDEENDDMTMDKNNSQIWNTTSSSNNRRRRRDGKTCLHYAARNGHVECIKCILAEKIYNTVDVTSNDGTTPLHMACYGGHTDVIWYLIEQCAANVYHANDYGCTMVHWIGLSPAFKDNTDDENSVVTQLLLNKLCDVYGVSMFATSQKHGHTILHKAAQKLNKNIIEYFLTTPLLTLEQQDMIGAVPDTNGHMVSTIWRSFGGNEEFAQRLERERNW